MGLFVCSSDMNSHTSCQLLHIPLIQVNFFSSGVIKIVGSQYK
jgi:hypothetical protein